jgi:hypothetical protein
MSITNGYADISEFLGQLDVTSHKPADDVYIEQLLERCSREFDGDTQTWFYAYTQTRRYDLPRGRVLELDAPLLSVTSLTNGDGTVIASTEYDLTPYNGPHHTALELHVDSTTTWEPTTGARTRGVVYVAGSWGYVDRDATDPESARVITNSKAAVLALALAMYKKRYGVGAEGVATVTGAGVVITPRDKSREYWSLASLYRSHL